VPVHSSAKSKTADNDRKDYAEFIDIAVHDLDAPLRKVSLLIDRLVHKNTTEPGGDLQDYFDRVQTSLKEMRTLIDRLSDFASLNSTARHNASCDMLSIINETLLEIRHKNPDKQIAASFSELPVLDGDKLQYRQLFQGLLQNAVSYNIKNQPVKIHITAEPLKDEEKGRLSLPMDKKYSKITVTDNGIGFEQQYAEKIFKPFTRLHGKSEYPGSGMGLAICRKIAENHNGIIYAESNQSKGASFTVILPQSL
jgi:signal transduction histidine kinase